MTARHHRPENEKQAAEGSEAQAESTLSPMTKFTNLARRLANVSREEYEREERKYQVANAERKRKGTD